MADKLRLEKRGRRVYVFGPTFPIKDKLSALGAHWDSEARGYWIAATHASKLESLVQSGGPSEDETQRARLAHDCSNILGSARYEGRSYYLVGRGESARGPWVRLLFRDGSRTFFAREPEKVEFTKLYQKPMTLRKLQEFAKQQKIEADPNAPIVEECWECGATYKTHGNVESGNMGCRRCG